MRNLKNISLIIVAIFCLVSCSKDKMPLLIEFDTELKRLIKQHSPDGTLEFYILPEENEIEKIPFDPLNPLTKEKIELGKLMFFETGLAQDAIYESSKGTYSCATCHIPSAGFRPGNFQGIADGGIGYGVNGEGRVKSEDYQESELDVQSARPLTLANVAYVRNTFWNGQFGAYEANEGTEELWDYDENEHEATELNFMYHEGIETQNIEGLETHRITINKEILDSLGYLEMYDEVFDYVPEEERYTRQTASYAYSAYIRSIITHKAPFQDWLKGNNNALNYAEKQGGILFFSKANCYRCHYNQNLGSPEFHALGVKDMYQTISYNAFESDRRNLGRAAFTKDPADNYKFKVPGIYNMEGTPFYFHGASKRSIREVIEYKNIAQSENENVTDLSNVFLPLNLSEEEITHLTAFVKNALKDPDVERFQPVELPSGQCFPNNDAISQSDLNCK